jgi:hypothetical protein
VLGVSESRVSQLLSGIRRTLRDHLDAYDGMREPARRRRAA